MLFLAYFLSLEGSKKEKRAQILLKFFPTKLMLSYQLILSANHLIRSVSKLSELSTYIKNFILEIDLFLPNKLIWSYQII